MRDRGTELLLLVLVVVGVSSLLLLLLFDSKSGPDKDDMDGAMIYYSCFSFLFPHSLCSMFPSVEKIPIFLSLSYLETFFILSIFYYWFLFLLFN